MSRIAFAAFTLLLAVQALAQNAETRIHTCFYAFGRVPGHESLFCPTAQDAYEEVRLSPANIVGPVHALALEGRIRLYGAPAAAEAQANRPLLAETRLPQGIRRALIVLFPAPAGEATPYKALAFEHDLAGFPLGVYRVINLSSHPVRGVVGRKIVEAKPGEITHLEPAGEPGSVQPVRFEYHQQERWNLLTETRAAIRKDRRWLMCVYQDPSSGRMNIRTIPDRTLLKVVP